VNGLGRGERGLVGPCRARKLNVAFEADEGEDEGEAEQSGV
jgi:hypothetical protein